MRDTVDEQKRMVYEILEQSKKPIMAKKIAKLIYRKFDGYRMSRFIVRDIIWKEMKGEFIYSRENYTYQLKEITANEKTSSKETIINQDNGLIKSFIEKLKKQKGFDTVSDFRMFIKGEYLSVNTGNDKFDELIKLVVKDNIITPSEELFLKEKSIELGLPYNLIEKVKEHIYSNNPYLDNIIHLIFEDGKITEKELIFLKEKETENNFSRSFVNQRFWQIGICFYLEELLKFQDFLNLIELWEIGRKTAFELCNSSTWIMLILDIHTSQNILEILEKGKLKFKSKLEEHLKAEFNFKTTTIEKLCDEYNLKYSFKENENKKDNNLSMHKLIKIVNEEKRRIGDPASDLLAENILFRIKN